jgi:HSP20 family protein
MQQLAAQFDRMFEAMSAGGPGDRASWTPRIDVRRRDGAFTVRADLPGVERDDVRVEVRDDALWIEGERRECETDDEDGYGDCTYGSFLRVLPLPDGADVEQGSARFENGVLEVQIPTREDRTTRRRIDVEGARSAEAIASAGRAAAQEANDARNAGQRRATTGRPAEPSGDAPRA